MYVVHPWLENFYLQSLRKYTTEFEIIYYNHKILKARHLQVIDRDRWQGWYRTSYDEDGFDDDDWLTNKSMLSFFSKRDIHRTFLIEVIVVIATRSQYYRLK